ncbi:MAG: hypothetical protein V7L25_31040 [Nostoc sp.]|uniref:hypothetical protein n=1 Tax=Nostoc sp. TaxID=1180 RepID=UPI002FF28309
MSEDKIFVPDHKWTDAKPQSVIATGETTTPTTSTVTAGDPPEDKLPDDFDPFQHLKEVYLPQHNAAVRLFFSDHPDDWKPNIATARSSLRVACIAVANYIRT